MEPRLEATGRPRVRPVRFTLLQQLIFGYSVLALLILAALFFSAGGLYSLNSTAQDIANKHLPAINSLTDLRNSLIAQESYSGKYAIFRSSEFRNLFHQSEAAFLEKLAVLEKSGRSENCADLKSHYGEYRAAAARLFAGSDGGTTELRGQAVRIFTELEQLYSVLQRDLQARLETANLQERFSIALTMGFSLAGLLLAMIIAVTFTYRTFSAVKKLRQATRRIAEGDFGYDPKIPAGDEIGALAEDFSRMAVRLKELEQMSLDASPLTRLPGNIAIERVLNRRLHDGVPFALCYADLDNFKAFTDNYGYVKGSELIRLTGEIVYETVKTAGGADAFVGHIGGDDFVIILSADNVVTVCEAVIRAFDAEVLRHYTEEDLSRGGIEGTDRYGVQRFFPIMTISIAVIINEAGEFSTAVEIAKAAGEIKDYAKEKPGSNYLISHLRKHQR
jgi:diguanylate cyclase (GGDEF)-like protein